MDRKLILLKTAEHLARTKGFDAFSYADLAKNVGINKASIHYHFPTKADLAFELIKRYRTDFFRKLNHVTTGHINAARQLCAYLSIYRDGLSQGETVCLCVAFSAGRNSFDARVLGELNGFHNESIEWLQTLFERADEDRTIAGVTNPKSEAHSCLALVEGAQIVARAAKDTSRYDDCVAGLAARLQTPEMTVN